MSEEYNEEVTDYERFDNEEHYTNKTLLEQLTKVGYSFGVPELGTSWGMKSIIFDPIIGGYQVYVRVTKKHIDVGIALVKEKGQSYFASFINQFKVTDETGDGHELALRALEETAAVVDGLLADGKVRNIYQNKSLYQPVFIRKNFSQSDDAATVRKEDGEIVFSIHTDTEAHTFAFYKDFGDLQGEVSQDTGENPVITVAGNSAARSSEYEIYMDDEKQGSLKRETSSGKLRITGDMNGKPVIIKGDKSGSRFKIQTADKDKGNIEITSRDGSDYYLIEVFSRDDYPVFSAFTAIIDDVMSAGKKKANRKNSHV